MKIYVVLGIYDYEGLNSWTMKSFASLEAADAYALLMTTVGIDDDGDRYVFDYSEVFEQEVVE